MALKGDREVLQTNILFKIEGAKDAERGTILIASATAGEALVPPTGSLTAVGVERPVGLLLDDVEDLDYTTRPQILVRNVQPRASEISLLTQGRVKTNRFPSSASLSVDVAAGRPAYLAASGQVSTDEHVAGSGIKVGHFESGRDADGYAHLYVDVTGGTLSGNNSASVSV